jgi:hypothetical protein
MDAACRDRVCEHVNIERFGVEQCLFVSLALQVHERIVQQCAHGAVVERRRELLALTHTCAMRHA